MRIRFFFFLETVEQHGDGVGNFLARGKDGLLANDFGGEKALGLVGELIRGKIGRRLPAGARARRSPDPSSLRP